VKPLLTLILLLPISAIAAEPDSPEARSVGQWIAQLKSTEFREQWYAAYCLGTLGPKAAAATPALHSVLVDVNARNEYNNEYSRSMAAWALGRIGPAARAEVPVLTDTMRATKLLAVRRSTAEALGNLGPAAESAEGELLKMLKNDDDITRVNAAVALWKISRHRAALPALVEMLRGENSSQAFAASVALGQIEGEADTVAPALIAALHASDADVRRAAARSLGQLGKAAFPSLKKANALHDPDPEARRLVVESLSWMGPTAVPALASALKDKDAGPAARRAAARALGNLGGDARAALPALEAAVSDAQDDVRAAAGKALRQVRGE
jgi:HEAT repeat protein